MFRSSHSSHKHRIVNKSFRVLRARAARGVALTQMMLALVIAAVLTYAAYAVFSDSASTVKQQELASQITQIQAAARGKLGAFNYAGVTTPIAVGHGVFPAGMVDASGAVATSDGGAVDLVDNSTDIPRTGLLTVPVASANCAATVQASHALAVRVNVGTTTVKAVNARDVDQAGLSTACAGAANPVISYVLGK